MKRIKLEIKKLPIQILVAATGNHILKKDLDPIALRHRLSPALLFTVQSYSLL